jgi:thiol-disulfide isomerase/thioredoxin
MFVLLAPVAAAIALSAGCANNEEKPVAEKPKYAPVEEAPGASAKPDAAALDESAAPGAAGNSLPGGVPPTSLPKTGSSPDSAGTAIPGNPYKVPNGTPEELLEFINRLGQQNPKGTAREAILADFQDIQNARLAAADKILAGKADDSLKIQAAQMKLAIFRDLDRLQIPGAAERMQQFANSLTTNPNPQLARFGRFLLFDSSVAKMAQAGFQDPAAVVGEVKKLLAGDKGSPEAYMLAEQVSQLLAQQGFQNEAGETLKLIADRLKDETDPELVKQAAGITARAKVLAADISNLMLDVLTDKPDAAAKLVAAAKQLLSEKDANAAYFSPIQEAAQAMEYSGQPAVAKELYDILEATYKNHENKELAGLTGDMIERARKRLSLIGKPITIEGVTLDGKPFDWNAYQGKVVLVDFWATWCGPCLEELPNLQANFAAFKDKGFDVVGVNLNQDRAELKQFFSVQELPWVTVISQEVLDGKEVAEFSDLPMAKKFGVEAIPFIMLVGKDGLVDSLHVRGPKLKARLTQLLGEPDAAKTTIPAEPPKTTPPAEVKPAEGKPAAGDKPATVKPAAEEKTGPELKPPTEKPAAEKPPAAAEGSCGEEEAPETTVPETTATEAAAEVNPYSAKPGLTTAELVAYVLKMLDKPQSIQARPGFSDAVVAACDRVLAAKPPAKEIEFNVAAESKFATLHKQACTGDEAADKRLIAFTNQMKNDARPRIARQVAFFQKERQVLDGVDRSPEQITDLLKQLHDYYGKEKLTDQHLRMASSTVALINKLPDGDEREKQFSEFGNLFAKSSDKELARYGKKLAKKPAAAESDLVGKELELAGATAGGGNFNWAQYRGKVVIVDFWATWCGPCIREMPHVKELYERLHDRGFEIVGISLDKDQEALEAFLAEHDIAWETLAGEETQGLAEKYGVRGIPTMMLVGKDGKVLGVSHNVAALIPLAEKELGAK